MGSTEAVYKVRHMILIVDDASDLRALLEVILVDAGYQVAGAASAEEGLMIAVSKKPRLVLLDLCMPGMDGFGFVRSIHKSESLKDVKVIILSGVQESAILQKAHALGVVEFFVKGSFEIEHLLSRVKYHAGPPDTRVSNRLVPVPQQSHTGD